MDEKTLFETIYSRRSIRKFLDKPVPRSDIEKILDAAIQAPSGSNAQPWHFIVIEDRNLSRTMREAVDRKMNEILTWPETKGRERYVEAYRYYFTFFDQAPLVIAVLGKDHQTVARKVIKEHGAKGPPSSEAKGLSSSEAKERKAPGSAQQSVAAAIENLLLAATALGYGACWMTGPLIAAEELEQLLGVEEPWYLVALIPLGYPGQSPNPRPRRGLDKVVSWK